VQSNSLVNGLQLAASTACTIGVEFYPVPSGAVSGHVNLVDNSGFFGVLPDHRHVLSWSDVEARNPVVVGLDVEASCQFVGAGGGGRVRT
jgi:hypothetical protein